MKKNHSFIHPVSAGLSVGLLSSLTILVWTLAVVYLGASQSGLEFLVGIYPKYDISLVGAFIGALWAFLDAFIGVVILAWLYNFFLKKLS